MGQKIRESDNGLTDEEIRTMVNLRNYSFTWINKVTFGFIGLLLAVLGTLIGHLFGTMEKAIIFNEHKFTTVLKESKDYTDSIMSQHIKEMKPYWESFYDVKKIAADTHDDVERITAFMEYKYGMPEKVIKIKR
jgi:hypothetical protein